MSLDRPCDRLRTRSRETLLPALPGPVSDKVASGLPKFGLPSVLQKLSAGSGRRSGSGVKGSLVLWVSGVKRFLELNGLAVLLVSRALGL